MRAAIARLEAENAHLKKEYKGVADFIKLQTQEIITAVEQNSRLTAQCEEYRRQMATELSDLRKQVEELSKRVEPRVRPEKSDGAKRVAERKAFHNAFSDAIAHPGGSSLRFGRANPGDSLRHERGHPGEPRD